MHWKKMGRRKDKFALAALMVLIGCTLFGVDAGAQAIPAQVSDAAGLANSPEPDCSCYRVDAILIEGLLRTRRSVVERELLFVEGEVATLDEVEESIQRLRNTGLFRIVEYELVHRPIGAYGGLVEEHIEGVAPGAQSRVLHVTVDERWTILPGFRFSRAGETLHLLVGLQDANFLGSYMQLGGQYSRLGEANSFALWFRNPRFLDERLTLSFNVGATNRTFSLYDQGGAREGGFAQHRRYVATALEREFRWWLNGGLHLYLADETFSYALIPDEIRALQEEQGGLATDGRFANLALTARFGRVDYDNYRVQGTQLNLRLSQNLGFREPALGATRLESYLFQFWQLPLKSTFGVRLGLGLSSGTADQDLFYAGGLDALRGVANMRFRGPYFFLANTELRVPSLDTRWLVLQHVFFADTVGVSPYPNELFSVSGASAGLGLRILSPKVYGFIIRLDYALPVYNVSGPGFSFGAGQFF